MKWVMKQMKPHKILAIFMGLVGAGFIFHSEPLMVIGVTLLVAALIWER